MTIYFVQMTEYAKAEESSRKARVSYVSHYIDSYHIYGLFILSGRQLNGIYMFAWRTNIVDRAIKEVNLPSHVLITS